MLRLIHSFWSKPAGPKELLTNLWLSTLSAGLVLKHGREIVLHTDSKGKELFDHIPYTQTYLTLENHDSHPMFWASGKIVAQEHEDLDTVHIDNDLFVFSERGLKLLEKEVQCLTYQDEEFRDVVPITLTSFRNTYDYYFKDCVVLGQSKMNHWANCSVVKIMDKELRTKYFDMYHKVCAYVLTKDLSHFETTPDCFAEQMLLSTLAEQLGVRVSYVSLNKYCPNVTCLNEYMSIQHFAEGKFSLIDQVKRFAQKHFPELYKRALPKEEKLLKLIGDVNYEKLPV